MEILPFNKGWIVPSLKNDNRQIRVTVIDWITSPQSVIRISRSWCKSCVAHVERLRPIKVSVFMIDFPYVSDISITAVNSSAI